MNHGTREDTGVGELIEDEYRKKYLAAVRIVVQTNLWPGWPAHPFFPARGPSKRWPLIPAR
jgi:hypothetical protein